MALEILSSDVLQVLVFLIPGYLGFITLLLFLTMMFPAFKYRPERVDTTTTVIFSILWSSIVYTIATKAPNFSDMVKNMSVGSFFAAILYAVGIAEILAGILWMVLMIGFSLVILARFVRNKSLAPTLPFWSLERLRACWDHRLYEEGIASDMRYLELVVAARNNMMVTVVLDDGTPISGTLGHESKKALAEFGLTNNGVLTVVELKDVKYVKIHADRSASVAAVATVKKRPSKQKG